MKRKLTLSKRKKYGIIGDIGHAFNLITSGKVGEFGHHVNSVVGGVGHRINNAIGYNNAQALKKIAGHAAGKAYKAGRLYALGYGTLPRGKKPQARRKVMGKTNIHKYKKGTTMF